MSKYLVIVESPAKAKTLSKMLGKNYSLLASMGHVRDLPRSSLGVNIEKDFTPSYSILRQKSQIVKKLKEAVKDAEVVYLATDPDREGEAISWHLQEVTRLNGTSYRRVVFHEITKEAIEQAFKNPRAINMHLVNAQQARRILDRLVGYKISPLLWKKVRKGLSAGRVQSVALKIIADREKEIENFKPEEYWTIEAELEKRPRENGQSFRALLISLFDGTKLKLHNKEESDSFAKTLEKANYRVFKVVTKKVTHQPSPPFITSTLQQEAWRKLHISARQTMATSQELYEGLPLGKEGDTGLITYMRTDSVHVAPQALSEVREFIKEKYAPEYLPEHARTFINRVRGAQEAHEAIRPTSVRREPRLIKDYLTAQQFRLYELIWMRMVASQMAALVLDTTTVDIRAKAKGTKNDFLFRVTSSVVRFPGFTILYVEGKDTEDEKGKKEPPLPELKAGDDLNLLALRPGQHFTQPPPRYTEATLIKTLESEGIGRPSTYATIMSIIQERDYVGKNRGSLTPTKLGSLVSDLMTQYFPDVVDRKFTAHMEEELDEVVSENKNWVEVVREFYTPFDKRLESAAQMEKVKIADETLRENCPDCGEPLVIKTGRFGKFIACSGYPKCPYHRSFQIKLNIPCPECRVGEVVERRSKKGRPFYGCSRYPDCHFVSSRRPLAGPCPRCGGRVILYQQEEARCTRCGYRSKIAEKEPSQS